MKKFIPLFFIALIGGLLVTKFAYAESAPVDATPAIEQAR